MDPRPPDSPSESEVPPQDRPAGLITYIVAGAVFALLGAEFHWLFSWTRGFAFALLAVWLVPVLYNRWRESRRRR